MKLTHGYIGDVLALIQNGVNCKQNKSGMGEKITRIETIADSSFNYDKTGFAQLDEKQKTKAKLEVGDILFSHINSPIHVGKTAVYNGAEPLYHGINLLRLRTIKEVDCRYFNMFLVSLFQSGYWRRTAKQSVNQASVNQTDIKSVPFSYPPLAEQQRIVARLDAAFAEIDEAINNIKLKDTKLDQFKLITLSDTFKDNNWDNIRLGDCIFYEKKNSKGSSLPYVGMENISSGSMELIGEITVPKKPKSSFYFNNSHVLFGRLRPYLRKVLVPDFEGQCSNEVFCIKPKANVVREFLAYWLLEQNISSKIEATSTGTRMPRANMNSLLEFNFPTPSIDEQKKIISKLNLIFTNIDRAKKALAKSKENYLALKSAILDQELQPPQSEAA